MADQKSVFRALTARLASGVIFFSAVAAGGLSVSCNTVNAREVQLDQPVLVANQSFRRPSGIKGNDDRVRVDIQAYPWRTIGRINRNGSFCTGVLVGSNKVLTAAHCFWNTKTRRWSAAKYFHFVVGYEKGKYAAHAKGVSYQMAFKKMPDLTKGELLRQDDWAILTLDKALGDQFGTVSVSKLKGSMFSKGQKQGGQIVQAGYSRDYAHVLTVHEECDITDYVRLNADEKPVFMHQCDATRGDSGSPILFVKKNIYSVIGIHSATAQRSSGEVIGIAVPSNQYLPFLEK